MLKRLMPYLVLLQLVLLVVVVFQVNSFTGSAVADVADTGDSGTDDSGDSGGGVVTVDIDGDSVLYGDPDDAKVVIVEYSDFQCPFCRKAWPTVDALIEKYGEDIAVVYKDFPLSFHPMSQFSAEAAECADEQGLFAEMHDILYSKQEATGSSGTVQYTEDDVKAWAQEIDGLDYDAWTSCLDNGDVKAEITEDYNQGVADGVRGTPAFFVNGVLISGAQPQAVFEAEIEKSL